MADQKRTSEILGKIFRNPDMQFGLSVFENIHPEEILDKVVDDRCAGVILKPYKPEQLWSTFQKLMKIEEKSLNDTA